MGSTVQRAATKTLRMKWPEKVPGDRMYRGKLLD